MPGHEGVGLVERLGDGVTHLSVGQRVAVPWLGKACRRCEHCLSGWETLCEQQINTGYGCDGGYAEKMLAWADFAQPVPDGVTAVDAAPLTSVNESMVDVLRGEIKALERRSRTFPPTSNRTAGMSTVTGCPETRRGVGT